MPGLLITCPPVVALADERLRDALRTDAGGAQPAWSTLPDLTDRQMLDGAGDLELTSPFHGPEHLFNHFIMISSAPIRAARVRGVHLGIRLKRDTYRPVFCALESYRRPAKLGWLDVPADHAIKEIGHYRSLSGALRAGNQRLARLAHLPRDPGPWQFTRSAFIAGYANHPRSRSGS